MTATSALYAVRASQLRLVALLSLVLMLSACATYGERVAPVPLPGSERAHVEVEGVKILAQAFANDREASDAFGFDIRGAGLLPVRLVIDNQSQGDVRVSSDQSFLIDAERQAWPLLSAEQAYRRVRSHVELGETAEGAGRPALLLGAAGAIVGAAIGIVAGHDIGETVGKGAAVGAAAGALSGGARQYEELDGRIRRDLVQESLRNSRIRSGELAYGYLFFPGREEAKSASVLRLAVDVNGKRRVVHVPL